jgi:RHS repeat-associated protein
MTVTLKMTLLRLVLSLLGLLAPVTAFADPAVTSYQYDPNGNLTQIADPLNQVTQHDYDSLDQAVQTRQPHPDLPGQTLGQIDTGYDGLGQITRLTDPRNLNTDYQRNAFGDLLTLTSPDTGTTTLTYDEAGNVKTQTDARSKTATATYDSQNRLTQIGYDDQTVIYTWDSCTHGIGRLCSLNNGSSQLTFSYDLHGRLTQQSQTVGVVTLTVGYHFNPDGQRDQLTTPDGQFLAYAWQNGRIASISVNGQPLIGEIAYEPDGQVGGWVWGNNEPTQRRYDLAGRPVLIDLGFDASSQLPETLNYSYDPAGRLTDLHHTVNASADRHHEYDGLDRLTASTHGVPSQNSDSYSYDLSGNRTGRLHNASAETHSIDPGSNRLLGISGSTSKSYSYDAAGHLTGDGTLTYTYNAEGRRISAAGPGLSAGYAYNGLGQRVKKTVNGVTTLFAYDTQGHLVGEYDGTGQLLQEVIWFGDLPIAVLKPVAPPGIGIDVFYLHADHLGTPRKVSRLSDNQVFWSWEGEAFGNTPPNQNPTGQGDFVFNLRFPGQYFDAETGLHYNYFRDYDPAMGRYSQSDPIGLGGGINTYAYVGGNPVNLIDSLGLDSCYAIGGRIECVTGQRPPPDGGIPVDGPLSPVGAAAMAAEAAAAACPPLRTGKVAVVQRWMSKAELESTKKTGLLRGGRDGTHYVTDSANSDPLRARQRLALDRTPEVRVTLEVPSSVLSPPSRVNPLNNMPGGGMERTATGNVPTRVLGED